MPSTIFSDRDKVFTNHFWNELFKLQGTKLNLTTVYHPQSDCQTEILNKFLGTYLRCMRSEVPKEWKQWLHLAKLWYNTNHHSAINTTLYEMVYGQPPPEHVTYVVGDSTIEIVYRSLKVEKLL